MTAVTKRILPPTGDKDTRSVEKRTRWDVIWRCDPGACANEKHTRPTQHRERFEKKSDATDRAAEITNSLAKGTYVDRRNPLTVVEYAREWAAARPHRETTAVRVAQLIDHHLEPTRLGQRRLVDVKPTEVQAWATGRAKVLAPSTLRLALSFVRSLFAAAVADRLIGTNPAQRVTLAKAPTVTIVPLTVAQVRDLAAAMPEPCRAMIVTHAGLGLRVSELTGLRVADIDFLHRTVHVTAQLDRAGVNRVDLKTPKSARDLPLPQIVADALAAHLAAHPADGPDSLVFTNRWGKGWAYPSYRALFVAAVKRAGLPKGTRSHDLRHHFASVLIDAGESYAVVADRLGHETAELVITTYSHLLPNREDRTRVAIDAAWAADPATTLSAVD